MKPDWLPNWRDEHAYTRLANVRPTEYMWEFLRRNREYQRDFERVRPLLDWSRKFNSASERGDPLPRADYHYPQALDDVLDDCICMPLVLPSETWGQYTEKTQGEVMYLYPSLCKRYGLRHMSDPSESRPPPAEYASSPPAFTYSPDCRNTATPKSYKEVAVMFNLEIPLDVQFNRARRLLRSVRRHHESEGRIRSVNPRYRPDRYPTYLRLLDAEQAGAATEEIARVIWPDIPNTFADGYLLSFE